MYGQTGSSATGRAQQSTAEVQDIQQQDIQQQDNQQQNNQQQDNQQQDIQQQDSQQQDRQQQDIQRQDIQQQDFCTLGSRISRQSKTGLLQADLGLDLHNGLPNCDHHSLIGQHAFQVVQQLLQACYKAANIVYEAFGSHPTGSEKKRKEKTTPSGVDVMRSQALCRAAQIQQAHIAVCHTLCFL